MCVCVVQVFLGGASRLVPFRNQARWIKKGDAEVSVDQEWKGRGPQRAVASSLSVLMSGSWLLFNFYFQCFPQL